MQIYAIDFPDTTGTGFVPVGHVKAEYFGIPGRVAPMAGLNSTVKPDGSFDMGIDTGTEFLQSVCNNNEIQNTTITVTEKGRQQKRHRQRLLVRQRQRRHARFDDHQCRSPVK